MDTKKFGEKCKAAIHKNPPQDFSEYLELTGVCFGLGTWAAGGASLSSGGDSLADGPNLEDVGHVIKGLMWLLIPATVEEEQGETFLNFVQGLDNLIIRKLQQNETTRIDEFIGSLAALAHSIAAQGILAQYATKTIAREQIDHVSRNLSEAFVKAIADESNKLNPEVGLSN